MVRPLHHGRRSSWWRLAASFGDLFDIYSVDLVDLAVRWRQVWPSSWVTCGRLFLRLSLCWLAVRCKWKIHVSLMSPLLNQSSSLACRRIAIILLLLLLQPERLVIQSRQTAVERRFQTQRKRKEGKKKRRKNPPLFAHPLVTISKELSIWATHWPTHGSTSKSSAASLAGLFLGKRRHTFRPNGARGKKIYLKGGGKKSNPIKRERKGSQKEKSSRRNQSRAIPRRPQLDLLTTTTTTCLCEPL